MANFLLPIVRHTDRAYELRNARSGRVVARTIIPAFDSSARRKGLLGRESLEDGVAMIIAPTNAIHTFWMRFPIDVAFVRRDGIVTKVSEGLAPWRASVGAGAYAVVELASGALRRGDVKVGDTLTLTSYSDGMDERCEPGRLVVADSLGGSTQVLNAKEV